MRRQTTSIWLLALVSALAGAGCKSADGLVVVSVTATPTLTGVSSLRVTATAGSDSQTFDVPTNDVTELSGTAFTFGIATPAHLSGTISVKVEARDAAQHPLGSGDGAGTVSPGERTDVSVHIGVSQVADGGSDLSSDGAAPPGDGGDNGPVLELVAGKIGGGSGNVDGNGTAARLYSPWGVAVDNASNTLYVADTANHTIRKVDLSTGAVSTFAGHAGQPGHTDGAAASALFNFPQTLVFEPGALFVNEQLNGAVRKIDLSSNTVSTLSNTSVIQLASDHAGFLYGSLNGQLTIKKIATADGTTTNLTLTGLGGDYPNGGIASDGTSLYITATTRAYKVNLSTGAATALPAPACPAGRSSCFFAPAAVAVTGQTLVLSQGTEILTMSTTDGAVKFIAGMDVAGWVDDLGTAARFNQPYALALSAGGSVFVADRVNNAVRKLASIATPQVSTVAGSGGFYGNVDDTGEAARFFGPAGIGVLNNTAYVADTGNGALRAVNLDTAAVSTAYSSNLLVGRFDSAEPYQGIAAVAVNPAGAGHVYFAGAGVSLFDYDVNAQTSSALSGSAQALGLAFDGTAIYYSYFSSPSSSIFRFPLDMSGTTVLGGDLTTAGFMDGTGMAALLNEPRGLALDNGGTLYVADAKNSCIRAITTNGAVVTTPFGKGKTPGTSDGNGTLARFGFPQGVAFDGAHTLYVADTSNSTVRKIDLTTGDVTTLVGVAGRAQVVLGPLPAGLSRPVGVAVGPGGDLLIVDSGEHAVLRVRMH